MKEIGICLNCGEEYVLTRRGVQKFCKDSCRGSYWQLNKRKKKQLLNSTREEEESSPNKKSLDKTEKMSLAGVGNAAAGAATVDLVKSLFTPLENKPATKKDIQELKTFIKTRYLPVNNGAQDEMGRYPYYDVETGNIVYLKN